jgi:chromosome segregation ATPase
MIENTLVQEILHEKEESFEADEEEDSIAVEAEEELTSLIEKKKTTLEEEKSKATTKIETLTSKSTDLESTIESTTKTITEVKSKIDTVTSTTTTLIEQKEHLKQQIKVVSVTEQSKIRRILTRSPLPSLITERKSKPLSPPERKLSLRRPLLELS